MPIVVRRFSLFLCVVFLGCSFPAFPLGVISRAVVGVGSRCVRAILAERYEVSIEQLSEVIARHPRQSLIIGGQHDAVLDPVLTITHTWSELHLRPIIAIEGYLELPWAVRRILDPLRPIFVPVIHERMSDEDRKQARILLHAAKQEAHRALNAGENVLVYPSGRLKSSNREEIGAKTLFHDLCIENPNAVPVLLTGGLWGSRTSKGATGTYPDLMRVIREAAAAWIYAKATGRSFPKHPVTYTFSDPNLPVGNLLAFNRFIEEAMQSDDPLYVPLYADEHRGVRRMPEPMAVVPDVTVRSEDISPKLAAEVTALIQEAAERKGLSEPVRPHHHLSEELGFGSLELAELIPKLEAIGKRHGVTQFATSPTLFRVEHAMAFAAGLPVPTAQKTIRAPDSHWDRLPRSSRLVTLGEGETLVEKVAAGAANKPGEIALVDERMGPVTWRRLLTMAYVIKQRFTRSSKARVGVMLPSSAAAWAAWLAASSAGKTVTYLNFQTGAMEFKHQVDTADVDVILTADAVLQSERVQKLTASLDAATTGKFVSIERLRPGFFGKLGVAYFSRTPGSWRRRMGRAADVPILQNFTSASTGLHKGVEYSDEGMRQLIEALFAEDMYPIRKSDRLFSPLPLFHILGSLTAKAAMVMGIPTSVFADPLDAVRQARIIERDQCTVMVTTPSFFREICRAAKGHPEYLDSLRLVVMGGEPPKADDIRLFKSMARNAELRQGYGATEAGIVTAQPLKLPEGMPSMETDIRHVGRALKGASLMVVDADDEATPIERRKILSSGKKGLLLVNTPWMMRTYLKPRSGAAAAHPIFSRPGPDGIVRDWYRTDDLAHLDGGSLWIWGRIGDSWKVGAERIGAGVIVEALTANLTGVNGLGADPNSRRKYEIVIVQDKDGVDRPILYTTADVTLEAVNRTILAADLSAMHLLFKVVRVDARRGFPELPSSKVAKRALMADALERMERGNWSGVYVAP